MSFSLNPQSSILNPILCLMGPTGSGKSSLARAIADKLSCEIISVDSAAIYRDMNIGTAKPTKLEREKAPYHLIDILDPAETYSAADFCRDASKLIEEIQQRQKIPLLVGGTMLYFKALQQGLSKLPTADSEIRDKITKEAEAIGWKKLHERLAAIDPVAAKRIHFNDPQRIQRALEVYELTGEPISKLQNLSGCLKAEGWVNLAVGSFDREILHQRIKMRFDKMLDEGFVEEVKKLYDRGDLSLDLPSMRSVGYRQIWQYLSGELMLKEATEKAIIATRQLAKRQLTWLKSWPNVNWVDGKSVEKIIDLIL